MAQNLGLSSAHDAARVIEETTGYPALSVLNNDIDEGVVAGSSAEKIERLPLDPIAFPGIRSTITAGLGEFQGALLHDEVVTGTAPASATLATVASGRGADVPHFDAYGLALNVTRKLYDQGVAVQGSPALAKLTAKTIAYLHHSDFDRLGLSEGDVVRVNGPKGSLSLPVGLCQEMPRGTLRVAFLSVDAEGSSTSASQLADGSSIISQVKLETK